MATKRLKQMYDTNHNIHNTYKRQQHILKNINHKLTTANAMITLADKSKATVIIYKHKYAKKVHTFLTDNNFHTLPDNPTNKDQTQILKTMQQCKQIIQKQHIKYLTQTPSQH
jgi:sialic acid synthase SpsE